MDKEFPFVDVTNPTWLVYVGLLVIAVYFRFTRFLTIRNLDISLLLLLSTAIVVTVAYRNQPWTDSENGKVVAENAPSVDSSGLANAGRPSDPAIDPTDAGNISPASDVSEDAGADGTPRGPDSRDLKSLDGTNLNVGPDSNAADAVSESELSSESESEATETNKTAGNPGTGDTVTNVAHPAYKWGSIALLGLTLMLLIRLVLDESLTRRPRLDQNLNQAGLTFLCVPAFAILMISVLMKDPSGSTIKAMDHGKALLERRDVQVSPGAAGDGEPAPTETLIAAGGTAVAALSGTLPVTTDDIEKSLQARTLLARILVVIAHTTVVLGLMSIARQHFSSLPLGIAMSCLYLLLPCTAVNVHELNQVLPAACLIWAFASYRNPVVAGVLLGLASGTLFFAGFLLPVWAVFYGRRGGVRFMVSVLGVTAVLVTCLMMISGDASSFVNKLVSTANWTVYRLLDDTLAAKDASLSQLFIRIPMAAVFFVMLTAMTVLPRPRNLENLLANSTSLIVAAQMWYPDDIGAYVLWYLPLFLLVIFRPRLDRFVPPEAVERQATAVTQPATPSSPSIVAMSRLTFFSRSH